MKQRRTDEVRLLHARCEMNGGEDQGQSLTMVGELTGHSSLRWSDEVSTSKSGRLLWMKSPSV
jgi:hypothetical protein